MRDANAASVLNAVLGRVLARYGGRQIFVFGAEGSPFWAARLPVEPEELGYLERALELIERLEVTLPKPFFAFDDEYRLLVAALDAQSDLYFVVLEDSGQEAAAARVAAIRLELNPYAPVMREEIRKEASAS
jgi:hypothetical protein